MCVKYGDGKRSLYVYRNIGKRFKTEQPQRLALTFVRYRARVRPAAKVVMGQKDRTVYLSLTSNLHWQREWAGWILKIEMVSHFCVKRIDYFCRRRSNYFVKNHDSIFPIWGSTWRYSRDRWRLGVSDKITVPPSSPMATFANSIGGSASISHSLSYSELVWHPHPRALSSRNLVPSSCQGDARWDEVGKEVLIYPTLLFLAGKGGQRSRIKYKVQRTSKEDHDFVKVTLDTLSRKKLATQLIPSRNRRQRELDALSIFICFGNKRQRWRGHFIFPLQWGKREGKASKRCMRLRVMRIVHRASHVIVDLAQLPSRFCQIHISPSRVTQNSSQQINSTKVQGWLKMFSYVRKLPL